MRCPACGHQNLAGEDQCARCEAALMQEDLLQPTTPLQRSIMTEPISALRPPAPEVVPLGTSLAETITRMKTVNRGFVCVTHPDGTLAGIFTDRDVIDKVAGQIEDLSQATVDEFLNPKPTSLDPSVPIAHGLHMMAIHGYRALPLVDDAERPIGVLSCRRIVQYIEEIA